MLENDWVWSLEACKQKGLALYNIYLWDLHTWPGAVSTCHPVDYKWREKYITHGLRTFSHNVTVNIYVGANLGAVSCRIPK